MKELRVKINFHYHGNWSTIMKAVAERYFVDLYNPWTEITNSHYEEWNTEWNKLNPDADIDMDEYNDWWFKYNRFIANKARPLEDKFNEDMYNNGNWYNKLFVVHMDPEYGSARICKRDDESNYMTFDMTTIVE